MNNRIATFTFNESEGRTSIAVTATEAVDFTVTFTPQRFADRAVTELQTVVAIQRAEINRLTEAVEESRTANRKRPKSRRGGGRR